MTKKRNQKRQLADKVARKNAVLSKQSTEKVNPFELRFSKIKQQVLGRKTEFAQVGKPGVSKEKSLQQRKAVLLNEYKKFGKANKIVDRRLGEKDRSVPLEQRLTRRFTQERQSRFKLSKYQLNEASEELTHYGQSLANIEKHDMPLMEDDDANDVEDRELSKDFVSDFSFGGGGNAFGDNKASRKTMLQEIIARSKEAKQEKQVEREETINLTEELDDKWREILRDNASLFTANASTEKTRAKPDSYDILVRQMVFDKRVKASDRLESPEEIALKERKKLENLEAERLQRMKNVGDGKIPQHVSADDLEENFQGQNSDRFFLEYDKEGNLIQADQEKSDASGSEEENEESEESSSEEDLL